MLDSFDDQSLQFDILASTLGMENQGSADLLEFLAQKLEGAVPGHTDVSRSRGLFSRKQCVEKIVVEFESGIFTISRGKHGVFPATIGKKVRGIVLRTNEVPVAEWTRELTAELLRMAEKSIETRDALQKLITG